MASIRDQRKKALLDQAKARGVNVERVQEVDVEAQFKRRIQPATERRYYDKVRDFNDFVQSLRPSAKTTTSSTTKETAPSINDLASFFLWEIDVKEGKLSASKQILKDTALKNWTSLRLGIKDTCGVE